MYAMVKEAGKTHRKKSCTVYVKGSTRARIYGFNFPKKVFTPSHGARFLLIFKGFKCEGFEIKAFTHGKATVKGWREQAFTPKKRW